MSYDIIMTPLHDVIMSSCHHRDTIMEGIPYRSNYRKYYEAAKSPGKGFPEKWKLFFKLFCYLRPGNVPMDSIEAAFMYEQVSQCGS